MPPKRKYVPPPPLPKVHLLSPKTVFEQYPELIHMSVDGLEELPQFLIGAYRLSRGSVFKADHRFPNPVGFVHPSQRIHVVLAAFKTDLEWPAFIHDARKRIVPEIMAKMRLELAPFYAKTPQSFHEEKERQRAEAAEARVAAQQAQAELERQALAIAEREMREELA